MIRFSCPKCASLYEVDDKHAGGKFYCKQCGQKLQIPFSLPRMPCNKTMLGEVEKATIRGPEPFAPTAIPLVASERSGGVLALGIVSVSLSGLGMLSFLLWPLLVFAVAGLILGTISVAYGRRGDASHRAGYICGMVGFWLAMGTLLTNVALFLVAILLAGGARVPQRW